MDELHLVLQNTAVTENLVSNEDLVGAVYESVNVDVNVGSEIKVDVNPTEPPISIIIKEATSSIPSVEEPFDYDDFDENFESAPQSVGIVHIVDNAIDEKIEEFRNKKNKTNPKICQICNKIYRTNYKLKLHMQTHSNNLKHKCSYDGCEKSFKSKLGLEEHQARHTGKFNFYCDVCSKGFLVRSYLLGHQRY